MVTSKEAFTDIVKQISKLSNDNHEIMENLKKLNDEYQALFDSKSICDTDGKSWEIKYNELKEQYRARFFSGEEQREESYETDKGEEITLDDLFENVKEG